MNANNIGQTKTVIPSTLLMGLMENHWRTLVYRSKSSIKTFKFLMSKFLFATEEQFSPEDQTALWLSWEKSVELSAVDQKFKDKHFHYLWITRMVVQSLNNEITAKDRQNFALQLKGILSHGRGYFSAHIYYGIKEQRKNCMNYSLRQGFLRSFLRNVM